MALPANVSPLDRAPTKGSLSPDSVTENFFKIKIKGVEVGRFRECTGIAMEVEMKDYNEGGNNGFVHKLPTRIKYPNLVLKRGVTHESALLDWIEETRKQARQSELTVTLMAAGNREVRQWAFQNAYPVKWTGPNLNSGGNAIATETLEIVHQGFRVP
jgi:phage tail-like protein